MVEYCQSQTLGVPAPTQQGSFCSDPRLRNHPRPHSARLYLLIGVLLTFSSSAYFFCATGAFLKNRGVFNFRIYKLRLSLN